MIRSGEALENLFGLHGSLKRHWNASGALAELKSAPGLRFINSAHSRMKEAISSVHGFSAFGRVRNRPISDATEQAIMP